MMMVISHDDEGDMEETSITCNLEVVLVLARVMAVFLSPQLSLKSRACPRERLMGGEETVDWLHLNFSIFTGLLHTLVLTPCC